MPTNLVELARFPTSAEASVVRALLECEGIRAELGDEAAASWLWHLGSAIGGVRLLVKREDVERAVDIIGARKRIDEAHEVDFGDASEDDHPHDDRSDLPEDLVRAWRASLIGLVLLPPLLNLAAATPDADAITLNERNGLGLVDLRGFANRALGRAQVE